MTRGANQAWSRVRRAKRRDTLVNGSGFHEFKRLPEAWARMSHQRCHFCRRGERNGLTGLWSFGPLFVCNDCAVEIEAGKMPANWGRQE